MYTLEAIGGRYYMHFLPTSSGEGNLYTFPWRKFSVSLLQGDALET
jgi:hypothetical protein